MPRSFLMRKNSAEELKELMKNSAPDKNEHEHETERHEDLIVDVESVEENEEHQFVEPPYIIRNEFLSDHLYSIQSYKRPIMSAPPPLTKAPPAHVRNQRPKEPPVLTMQSQDECWKTKIDTLLAAAQLMKLRESVVLKEKMWPNNKYNDLPSPSESEASSTTSLEEGGGFPKYQCHQCHKVFKTKYTLTIHMRMPDHTKTRPFVCNICGKGFRLSSTLCRHKIIHTTEKPHKCQHCHKAFNRSSTLKTHMKTHSQQKDFVCDICDKGFHQKGNLRNHRLVHTGERPFQCTECDKSFCKLSNLKLHMQSHETGGSE